MLKQTRVSRHMDVGRLSEAVSRPGIDPRIWVSLAVAASDSVVDEDHGVFVDVILLPTMEQYTARVGTDYNGVDSNGNAFGEYMGTIHQNDELLVEATSGDPQESLVVTRRLFSAAELPPQDAIDNPADVCLTIQSDSNYRLRLSGQGQVVITTAGGNVTLDTGGGMVNLSQTSPADFVALAQKVLTQLTNITSNLTTNYSAIATGIVEGGGTYTPTPPSTPESVAAQYVKAT